MINSAGPDQLASLADLDLHSFQIMVCNFEKVMHRVGFILDDCITYSGACL